MPSPLENLPALHRALASACARAPLAEKWLLCPSRRIGQQWLDTLARAGHPGVNVRLHTLASFALAVAGPADRHLISPVGRTVLAAKLLGELGPGYLGGLRPSLALAERLAATLHDLRLAGLEPENLEAGRFEVPAKGRELIALLTGYERELTGRQLVDDADLLRSSPALPPGVIVLVPADLELAALHRRLLNRLPAAQRITLPVDETPVTPITDSFRAIGETNEVREVLRRCLVNGWPLDTVEILHTDSAVYLPRLFELTEALAVPATFAEGIPVSYTRPGRALAGFLAWIGDDFPQAALLALMRDGLLEHLPATLAGQLRRVPIGFGRDRYLAQLDHYLRALDRPSPLAAARAPLAELLACAGQPPLTAATEFLTCHIRCVNELDNFARDVLQQRLAELAGWLPGSKLDVCDWLRALLAETRVRGEGPRPGHLYVARWESGGHSGRPHTFLVGLDADRFPPAGRQDPVLLDSERRALSADLPTAAAQREAGRLRFDRLRARLRGTVTASFASHDITGDAERSAGWELPAGPTVATAPSAATAALSETEWWLWRLCAAGPVAGAGRLVGEWLPWLQRGMEATTQRASDVFTGFDGLVTAAGGEPTEPFSAHRLEMLGTCPRRYFYRYALGLREVEEWELDPERWLPAREFGLLLHDVFCRHLRDGEPLAAALAANIALYRERFPPPSEGVFRRDCRRLDRACRMFAAEPRTGQPVDFEAEIPPQPIALPDGATILVRGRMDRVDEVSDGLELWDYKTGGTAPYAKKNPLREGRVLQHALYIAIAQKHYRQPVTRFCYYFPTEKGRGETLEFTPAELAGAPAVLAALRQLVVTGVFPATTDEKDCRGCDFQSICGDVNAVTAQSARKLRSPANDVLAPFRELRREAE